MCSVSYIGDRYRDDFPQRWPSITPLIPTTPAPITVVQTDPAILEEIKQLRKEVAELKKLLKAAKKFDEKTGQKDCEMDEKIAFIKNLAKLVGIDMSEVFK